VLIEPGWGVGWLEDATWENATLQLQPGDRFFICSDGVSEAKGPGGELFQNERILNAICAARSACLEENVEMVLNQAGQWTPRFTDDVSIIAVEYVGTEETNDVQI